MLISCLCVTENRPEFMDWLVWNYQKQTWPERELVIVDSSAGEGQDAILSYEFEDVRVIRMEPGTGVAEKRNVAMREARGEIITWFDDDDWQHPDKCWILAEALAGAKLEPGDPDGPDDPVYVGAQGGWFVRLRDMMCRRYEGSAIVLLPTFGGRRVNVATVEFVDGMTAPDVGWLWRICALPGRVLEREDLSFWLCHEGNTYNRPERWEFDRGMEELRGVVGPEAWGETLEMLAALRGRLEYGG